MNRLYHRIRRRFGPRRFRAFAVGPGKTGTTSMATMFTRDYRAAHEPGAAELIGLLLENRDEPARSSSVMDFMQRDGRERLEMNASSLNTCVVDVLVEGFSDAKFILTVRDCVTWTNSAINQQINNPLPSPHFVAWRVAEFGDRENLDYAPEEQELRDRNVWPLDNYLSLWRRYYQRVLDIVPAERLLVVRTLDLNHSVGRIADFLGIDPGTLDAKRTHAHGTKRDNGILASLDRDFVNDRFAQVCGPLMGKWFPGDPLDVRHFLPDSKR